MSTKRYIVSVRAEKKKGRSPEIHNNSGRTIFLIPIYGCDEDNARSSGQVINKLAKTIKAGKPTPVDWKDPDRTETNSNLQIYILFRAPDTENRKEYLKYLNENGVKMKEEEKLLLCTELKKDLHLDCQVMEEGKEEDKEAIPKQVAPERLVDLIKNVLGKQEELKEDIKALLKEMKILMEAWKSFDQNQTKLH